ncbi:hypothetical protein RE6C_00012 [Rhodopirellula europaea 6C]|uniref:Uncharacterized protein n=1 Tax=Rhodopirellula europaea 6C TaxID=1263867 RepID=M2BC63_9BACT|nr:hypothetical protein RE6C_00012 [Rhodopirellula europaea 6C]
MPESISGDCLSSWPRGKLSCPTSFPPIDRLVFDALEHLSNDAGCWFTVYRGDGSIDGDELSRSFEGHLPIPVVTRLDPARFGV